MSKKIMFNDKFGLTQAVLDGRKTMTRRIIKPQPQDCSSKHKDYIGASWKNEPMRLIIDEDNYAFCKYCGYGVDYFKDKGLFNASYKVGEIVAIAQSYKGIGYNGEYSWVQDEIHYHRDRAAGWTNKMFVKANLMPHHIEITGIKIERLQDISDEDCLKEGIYRLDSANGNGGIAYSFVGASDKKHIGLYNTPRDAFEVLIDKVSGKGVFQSNPYVFVYEFNLIK